MTASRRFGVFTIVFAVAYCAIYILVFVMDGAAFTYHAALSQFALGQDKPREGPAMYWYGWIVTAGIAAVIIATIAAYLPDSITRKVPPASAWVVPVAAMVTAAGMMVHTYFLR